MTRVACNIGQS